MPAFIHTAKDEARWARAKEAAGKSTNKDSESYWKLSNYIYHKMGKSENDASNAEFVHETMDQDEKKLAKDYYESQASFLKSEDATNGNNNSFNIVNISVQQSIGSKEVENMSHEKKYSAKDAAIAVLKKAEEILQKHEALKKSENPFSEKEGKAPKGEIAPKEETQGESVNPGERVEEKAAPQPTDQNPKVNGNPEWGTNPGAKGHFKLAKFCGYIEAKRKTAKPAAPVGAA